MNPPVSSAALAAADALVLDAIGEAAQPVEYFTYHVAGAAKRCAVWLRPRLRTLAHAPLDSRSLGCKG